MSTFNDTDRDLEPTPPGPDPATRVRLAREYQAQAAGRPDLLAANLGLVAGDLMILAHGFGVQVAAALAAGGTDAAADPRFARVIDTYLRCIRQIDRFAQLERRPAGADGNPVRAGVRPDRKDDRS